MALLPRLACTPRWQQVTCVVPRRSKFFWGHDTVQDQEARKAESKKKGVIAWSDPKQKMVENQEMQWAPARIEQEAKLSTEVMDKTRPFVNVSDWLSWGNKKMMKPYALTWLTDPVKFREDTRDKLHARTVMGQIFLPERLTTLGPDLAAAHFLCHRNCRVRFRGHTEWTELGPDGSLDIPAVYVPGWYIEAIEASSSELVYEGLANLKNLHYLKELDISYCNHIDEWCMDRITGEYHATLEVLNISGCRGVNWNALEVVWRLSNLKKLIIKDMDHIEDLNLICLMLMDVLPKLQIIGADYLDTSLLEGTKYEHLLLDDGSLPRLEPGELLRKDEKITLSKVEIVN